MHRGLHSQIHDISTPNGDVCKRIYYELLRQEAEGLISISDPAWVKLEWLAEQVEEICPVTYAQLCWQRDKIWKFYKYKSQEVED